MNPIAVGALVLVCTFGGALAGIWLRGVLPEPHLSAESSGMVKVGVGLIATMTALVFLVLEMDGPFEGVVKVSPQPLRYVLGQMNQ